MNREFRPMSIHETYRPPRLTPRGEALIAGAVAGLIVLAIEVVMWWPYIWVRNP